MTTPGSVRERIEYAEADPDSGKTIFLLGPVENLVEACAQQLRITPEFGALFGASADDPGSIDTYKRLDYDSRQLPALRIYNEFQNKQFDSWFITGDLILDLIFPPALRRKELQHIPDVISNALLQQFRRPNAFFEAVSASIPGLNELGKTFDVDKSMGFEWGEDVLPLTQIKANFRIDLRIWDDYLEQSGRTKDDPFNVTIGDLKEVVTTIAGLKDDNSIGIEITSDQALTTQGV